MDKIKKNIINSGLNTLSNLGNKAKGSIEKTPEITIKPDLDTDVLSKKIDATKEIEKLTSETQNKNAFIRVVEAINKIILG